MKLKTIFGIAGTVMKLVPGLSIAGATFAGIAAAHMADPDVSQASQPKNTDAINSIIEDDNIASQPFEADVAMINGHFIALGEETTPYQGHADYCKEFPDRCDDSQVAQDYTMVTESTVGKMQEKIDMIFEINQDVNNKTTQILDKDNYKKPDYWTIAVDSGDCEDIVLHKRELLQEAGIPYSSMALVAVDPHIPDDPSLHAVLMVRTGIGDLILDNRTNEVKFADETGYTMLQATSPTDFSKWQVASIAPKIDEQTYLANLDRVLEGADTKEEAPVPLPRNARPGGYSL